MATVKFFNNKRRILPGIYSTIKSGIQNPPSTSDFSKVLIIDTGEGAAYGGGSGITGDLASGSDSIYQFTDLISLRAFLKGGLMWKAVEGLFKPDGAAPGASVVYHVKAATTGKATGTFTATGGGAAGGTFAFNPKDEGLIGNGTLTSTDLTKGYAWTIESGIIDTAKWIFKIWVGTYKGAHTDGYAYDEVALADSITPILLAESPEFNNIQDLIDWADNDSSFGEYFVKDSTCAVTGAGTVDAADVAGVTGYNVTTGGTETYGADDLTDALEAVKDLDYTHILCDAYGDADYDGTSVGAIVSHIESDAKYDKYMFIGGGSDKAALSGADGSIVRAEYFDTRRVIVCHSDIKLASSLTSSGFRTWPTVVTAAYNLGRTAGLEPQIPATWKSIGIDGLVHNPTDKEKIQALEAGVWMNCFDTDFNNFIILQGVNTLQNNTNLINGDASSFSHQVERIKAQLNKDLTINAKIQLFGQPNGVNRNTLSEEYIKNWTKRFLESKKATAAQDNLIISYQDINVTLVSDYYEVKYGFVVNNEITKVFYTGVIIG
jgi:hypothetical protein